jgi:excisionase family DNA binding protein
MPQPDDLLSTAELAKVLGVHERTIRQWRADGTGPPVLWAGSVARYKWSEVEAWLRRREEPREDG